MLCSACEKNTVSIADTSLVCPSWKEVTIVKGDVLTEGTARTIEGNNEARLERGCPPDPRRVDRNRQPAKKTPGKPEPVTS